MPIARECKLCPYWNKGTKEQDFKMVKLRTIRDKVLFRQCLHPYTSGMNSRGHALETMVLAVSKNRNPLYTHAGFGCFLPILKD